jgi:hypothetical protein
LEDLDIDRGRTYWRKKIWSGTQRRFQLTPVAVQHNNGTHIVCGKAIALTGPDQGESRPPTDRTNRFMTSATVNFLNCDGYVLVGDQLYFVQKCKLLEFAKTSLSSRARRAYKCVSVKYPGVEKPRLLWLDQPFAIEASGRPNNQRISDILESDDLVPIDSNPREAKKQVEALIAKVMESIQGDTVDDDGMDEVKSKRAKSREDEEETDLDEREEDEDEQDEVIQTDDENEQDEFGESQPTVHHQSQGEFDFETATSTGDQWVSVHAMQSALDEKDTEISRLEV